MTATDRDRLDEWADEEAERRAEERDGDPGDALDRACDRHEDYMTRGWP